MTPGAARGAARGARSRAGAHAGPAPAPAPAPAPGSGPGSGPQAVRDPTPEGAANRPAERVLRLDLEYDGTHFAGWQRQPSDRSVQAVVEEALGRLLGETVRVAGAGRTDAGVHAAHMTASVGTSSRRSPAEVLRGLDALLPADVGVLAVTEAPLEFHALRDARWKWYRYTWLLSRTRRVHLRASAWRVEPSLDVGALREAGARLPGRRDFACFQSSGSPRASTVRCLAGLALETEGPLLHLDVVADGFLYGMVRAIAGTLTEVGRGRRAADSLEALLASGDRRRAGAAAPAHGLSLRRVGYAGDPAPAFVDPGLRADLESGGPARLDTTPPVGGPGP